VVDHSGGALSAWVLAAHHLGAGRTQKALDVASGNNENGVVIDDLAGLLRAGRVEDAVDAAATMPAIDCSAADASLLAALESADLATLAIAADLGRSHGRTMRAALLGLVDRQVCEALGDSDMRCAFFPERMKALGLTAAELVGGDLDVGGLAALDPQQKVAVDDAAAAVGTGTEWAAALRRHFATMAPGVGLCMDSPFERGVGGPTTDCDPADVEAVDAAESARWERESRAWEGAQASWGARGLALEQAEHAVVRYGTRSALLTELEALDAAVARRKSIETDIEGVEAEIAAAKRDSLREELRDRKMGFAKELAEDLLVPGAADRAARLERVTQELAVLSRMHGAAIDAIPGLHEARAQHVAAETKNRRAEARWTRHQAAWGTYRRALRTAPHESPAAWRRTLARGVIPPMDLRGPQWSAGLQVAGGYDRMAIYLGAVHDDSVPRQVDAFSVELGAQGTISVGHVSLQARAGVAVDQIPRPAQVSRCIPTLDDGGDSTCEAVPFIEVRPAPVDSGYVRLGALLLSPDAIREDAPMVGFASMRAGLDLRLGFEDLGRETLLEARVTLLAFPILGPLKGRYGVGFRSLHHITACDAGAGVTSRCGGALKSFTPFAFVGGAFLR
jgi:hypothetical protein